MIYSNSMDLQLHLQQKPTLQVRITPKLKFSIAILQKPMLELKATIEQALAENPFLESESPLEDELSFEQLNETPFESDEEEFQGEKDESVIETLKKHHDYILNHVTSPVTLYEHLQRQLRVNLTSGEDVRIGSEILGNLNHDGYLTTPIEEIALGLSVPEEAALRVLGMIQTFEPYGVGARNLKECLLIQLKTKNREKILAWRIVETCLDYLSQRRLKQIAKRMKISLELVREAVKEIMKLDPKPGRSFAISAPPVIPDVTIEKQGNHLNVECCDGYIPRLTIQNEYNQLLKGTQKNDPNTKELKQKYQEAIWLVGAIKDREKTLAKIAKALVKDQADFFEKGPTALKPLTASELARRMDLHPSTLSRAIKDKYIATPFGVFSLSEFFPKKAKLASGEEKLSRQMKEYVQQAVAREDSQTPMSDQAIVDQFKDQGISIARRTVAKYRKALGIPPAHLRRN